MVRTDGRSVYGHVITKFSGMGRFTYPWCSAGALRAPELRYKFRLLLVRNIYLLAVIFSLEAVLSQVTARPPKTSAVIETHDLTLVWSYSLRGSISFATFTNNSDTIASRQQDGSISVVQKYRDRFTTNITDTQAWLQIRRVQITDQGNYQFFLSASSTPIIQEEVEVIVHSKYLEAK